MVNIFTILIGLVSTGILGIAAHKAFFRPTKIWEEIDWFPFESDDELTDGEQAREWKPHRWIDE